MAFFWNNPRDRFADICRLEEDFTVSGLSRNEDGTITNWACETSAANSLIRRGWKRDDLPVGTVITAEGFQARNGTPTANIRTVVLEDGRRLISSMAVEQRN